MKIFKIKTLLELKSFKSEYQEYKFNYKCHKEGNQYRLLVDAGEVVCSNRAMISFFSEKARAILDINIDTKKLLEAYLNLNKEEQFKDVHNNNNPFHTCEEVDEQYLVTLLELRAEQILENLKQYSGKKDNYSEIARLAVMSRGRVWWKLVKNNNL